MDGLFLSDPLSSLTIFNDCSGDNAVISDSVDVLCDGPSTSTLQHLIEPNVNQLRLSFLEDDITNCYSELCKFESCSNYNSCDDFDFSTKTNIELSTDVDNCMIDLNGKKSFTFKEVEKKSINLCSTSSLEDEVRCFTSDSKEAFAKKKSKKCKLPQVDPQISEHWHQTAMPPVELLSYTLGVFNDLLPRDLADC